MAVSGVTGKKKKTTAAFNAEVKSITLLITFGNTSVALGTCLFYFLNS
jgi:hypothetical protein